MSEENYEVCLAALGVRLGLINAIIQEPTVMDVLAVPPEYAGDWSFDWLIRISSPEVNGGTVMERRFKVGEAFDAIDPDGEEYSAMVTLEGNKLISEETAKVPGQKSAKTVREFTGDECIVTMTVDKNIVCVQKFKKV